MNTLNALKLQLVVIQVLVICDCNGMCIVPDPLVREAKFVRMTSESNYSKWLRPTFDSQVLVNISVEMYSMAAVNEKESEFNINLLADLEWADSRLAVTDDLCPTEGSVTIEGSDWHLDRIWSPKLRVPNNKNPSALDRDAKIVLMRVTTDGYVRVRKRLNLDLFCQMNFQYYPFDTQKCYVSFVSSDLSDDHLAVEWTRVEPFNSDTNFYMTGFKLMSYSLKSGSLKTKNENFSSVSIIFNLKREWTRALLDLYLPTSLVIIVSWISFWMEITATPARITLGITTMLTFVTVAKEARERLPNISYVNALDIWFVVCTGFIFLSLIEFSVVTYISRAEKRKIKEIKTMRRTLSQSQLSLVSGDSQLTIQANDIKNRQNISRFSFEGIELKVPQSPRLNSGLTLTVPSSPVTKRNYLTITPPETPETPNFDRQTPSTPSYDPLKRTPVEIAESIDRKCRIVFPIMFVVFNLVYWTTILLS